MKVETYRAVPSGAAFLFEVIGVSERSAFFDASNGDRSYDAASFARVFESLTPRDGIVAGADDELEVVASSPAAMSVEVSEGVAWIQGRYYQLYSSPEVLTVPAADSTNDRIDRVVVRLDLSTAARTISVAYVEGTAASSPSAPSLTRNSETWELSLAQILVEANATEIETADITDERGDTTLCGAIQTVNTLHLVNVPTVRVYHDADQSVSDSTMTALAFNSERFDTDSMHDVSTNNSRLTANTPGYYQITACVRWEANANGLRLIRIRLNGTTDLAGVHEINLSADILDQVVTTLWYMEEGDYVECTAYQTSGAPLNVQIPSGAHALSPEFMMVRVG